ncbi:flagellar assembly peptidoglycan hydrolase FlgJ [Moritella viscosa]|uniref:Peptidoglycan hydrolase FlgJ n=1 Tax=Moritella viscosa TaxID=80854 RepID=A0A090ILS0_9GAMM|nr:flagellar assembly peptidoglycan hydrolase FlgJ [Moritella viscosa]CED61359.1 flagellar protein FlgJ [Moritella viscosa]SGY88667.1 Flagellar protein FlgJ [Moritella viscosa]SGY92150.1 Flagellar protein FlgJ [Moritella viscosa]SGY92171.1 Flagellar protein FlgJ [Moritella viscosa]SGY95800.1 Flagellar protein FlgJ [Moritella viscosa]
MDNSFKTNVSSNVLDTHNLDSLRKSALNNDEAALKEVAKQFESLFTNMLMKSMRDANAAFETESPMNNNYTQFYRDMQDKQMAADMSQSGSMGLADVIVKQLSNNGGNYMPASSLQGDSNPLQNLQANKVVGKGIVEGKDVASVPAIDEEGNPIADGKQTNTTLPTVEKPRQMQFNSPEEFVTSLAPFADSVAKRLNVSPDVLLAQAALETGWGKKVSTDNKGDSSHNLFNIKADKRWEGPTASVDTLEFTNGVAKREKHQFRSYQNFQSSFNDFADFLQSGDRYSDALRNSADSAQFLNGLQNAGYATDPNYAAKIQNVMKHDAFK